ncbi:hypothetical protein MVEN_01926100 [Mycena venus]|uniref:Uncharacterized protein n=1 Tax=Mycena venus TaxID=2733690 RepID=A0A8H6XER7_9AGAR|nr:hypothetical protein MVEN_01926100 [Mycena venus]
MNDEGTSSSEPGPLRGDIGTSYPSPISSAGSPNMEETNRQPGAETLGQGYRPADARGHSLRAASDALQAAYRRIRQVRRNLVELTNDEPLLPSPHSLNGDIGPNHSALLLTTSPVEEASDNDDTIDFQRIRANLAAVDRQTQEYLDRFAPGSWSDHQPPSNVDLPRPRRHVQLPSPSSSSVEPHQQPAIRRSMLESQLARRRELYNSDDPSNPSTSLGRRVAAREAAWPSRAVDTPPQPPMDPILRAVEMERELIHLRAMNQQRRTDPGVAAARADALSRAEMIRATRSLDMEIPADGAPIAPLPKRDKIPTIPNPPASAHPDSRLSILSNFSVQNLPTPTSAISRDRPLLFEEPLSYTGQRRESADIVDSPIGAERSYFIHRRVNADGDELVHNINLEWDDEDPLSWLTSRESQDLSAYPRRRFFDAHERSDTRAPRAPPSLPEPRRRGWARLDPDGNAIPSDEEEELERSRAEYRVQALYQARASAAAVTSRAEWRPPRSVDVPPHPNPDGNLVTRTYIDDHTVREATTSPRVRLNSRDAAGQTRVGFGSVMDSVLAVDNRPSRPRRSSGDNIHIPYDVPYGSSVPFVVDPLPIPLSEMMPPMQAQKGRLTGVRVSRNAGLFGR